MTKKSPDFSVGKVLAVVLLLVAIPPVITADSQPATSPSTLPGRLLMFPPPVSDVETESTPYCMDLSSGVLTPKPVTNARLPDWYLPIAYDEVTNSVYFVVNRGLAVGRLDLNMANLKCEVIEPIGHDSDLVGITPAIKGHNKRTSLANLHSEDSFFIGQALSPFGNPVDVYAPAIHGGIYYLAYATKQRSLYCIVTSWHKFKTRPISVLPDSSTVADSNVTVDRVILRLIRVDSTGRIQSSKSLKPVVYIGFDISPDGQWCALPEPVDPEPQTDLLLLNLLTDSILRPDLGAEYNLAGPVFSPDGQRLAVAGNSRLNSRRGVFISKAPRFDRFELVREHLEGEACALTWSPDSDFLMIGVKSSLTGNIFQGLEAIHIPTGALMKVPAPKITSPEEAVLLSKFQQYAWIR